MGAAFWNAAPVEGQQVLKNLKDLDLWKDIDL